MKTYITSDWHFCHTNIIKLSKRPFQNIQEMEKKIIDNTNKIVMEGDRLILAGDICLGQKKAWEDMLDRIKCKNIILIQGNHDTWKNIPKNRFSLVAQQLVLKVNGKYIIVSHYPYRAAWWKFWFHPSVRKDPRRPLDKGRVLLHGHDHRKTITCDYNSRMLSVGVDANNFKPVEIESFVAKNIK